MDVSRPRGARRWRSRRQATGFRRWLGWWHRPGRRARTCESRGRPVPRPSYAVRVLRRSGAPRRARPRNPAGASRRRSRLPAARQPARDLAQRLGFDDGFRRCESRSIISPIYAPAAAGSDVRDSTSSLPTAPPRPSSPRQARLVQSPGTALRGFDGETRGHPGTY
jgi:hypothetical protein